MKTPLPYYGGKQQLLKYILPRIPKHRLYAEPFCGGAAVYWAKEPAEMEIINDTNVLVNLFYRTIQTDFEALIQRMKQTLHSEYTHQHAWHVYSFPEFFSNIEIAWAVWALAQMSFSAQLNAGYSFGKKEIKHLNKLYNAVERAQLRGETEVEASVYYMEQRIRLTQVLCKDAISILNLFNEPDAFFFVDPPYFNANMGHYDGYTFSDFQGLLNGLANVQGKFMLTCYDSDLIREAINQNGWNVERLDVPLCAYKGMADHQRKMKTELLVMNYLMPN